MKNNNMVVTKTSAGSCSFVGLLQIVFIVLKLCGIIDWSWWCVLLPFIISSGVFVLLLLLGIICACIAAGR